MNAIRFLRPAVDRTPRLDAAPLPLAGRPDRYCYAARRWTTHLRPNVRGRPPARHSGDGCRPRADLEPAAPAASDPVAVSFSAHVRRRIHHRPKCLCIFFDRRVWLYRRCSCPGWLPSGSRARWLSATPARRLILAERLRSRWFAPHREWQQAFVGSRPTFASPAPSPAGVVAGACVGGGGLAVPSCWSQWARWPVCRPNRWKRYASRAGAHPRHDYLVNVLQSVVEALLFYHPAVCGYRAIFAPSRSYAATWPCPSATMPSPMPAPGGAGIGAPGPFRGAMAASGGSLAHRVARLLGQPDRPHTVSGLGIIATAILLAIRHLPCLARWRGLNLKLRPSNLPSTRVSGWCARFQAG